MCNILFNGLFKKYNGYPYTLYFHSKTSKMDTAFVEEEEEEEEEEEDVNVGFRESPAPTPSTSGASRAPTLPTPNFKDQLAKNDFVVVAYEENKRTQRFTAQVIFYCILTFLSCF